MDPHKQGQLILDKGAKVTQQRKDILLNRVGTIGYPHPKNEPHLNLIPYKKFNSKWIIDLTKSEGHKGENSGDLGLSKVFLDMIPKQSL